MTTQPELPEVAPLPARPLLYVAPPPAESDVDFDGFVRAYEARLRRLVMRRIGDLCEAEEITQETLLRAYQHRAGRLRGERDGGKLGLGRHGRPLPGAYWETLLT